MEDSDSDFIGDAARMDRRGVLGAIGGLGALGVGSGLAGARPGGGSTGSPALQESDADWSEYTKTQLSEADSPVMLDVAPDGRVFYIEFGAPFGSGEVHGTGEVVVIYPELGTRETVLEVPVYSGHEDGMLGILLDSEFEETGHVYLYYSPSNEVVADSEEALEELNRAGEEDAVATPPDESVADPYNLLARYTMEDGSIDPDSQVEILRVPVQREVCCHTGGDMHWGPDGENLYLTTGDNTNPFESDGYTPIDEREGRRYYDAQRTAGNTNDLRGSVLRIAPQEDGSYTVPDGNLFTGDEYEAAREDDLVKPEIYVMGCRNPYRAEVDEDGRLLWGDYGPDAYEWDAERGPPGIVEFNWTDEPGFFGWPYFTGPNNRYVDYVFGSGSGDDTRLNSFSDPFDPDSPRNDSRNNDGLTDLPPSVGADVYYVKSWEEYLDAPEYAEVPDEAPFPDLTGGGPMAGPVYRHPEEHGEGALPNSFDGKFFVMEWTQGWIRTVTFDDDGNVAAIEPFMPDTEFLGPQDLKAGPDGALYLVEWGEGYVGENAGIYRLEHDPSGSDSDGTDDGNRTDGDGDDDGDRETEPSDGG